MKTINKVLGVAMMGALGLGAASCTDGNDWGTDSSYARIFGAISSKVSVETELDLTLDFQNVSATVTFPGPSGAEYHVIEVSTDSLYDDIPLGGTEHSLVYGEDRSITKSPATITGLEEDTKYYLRIVSKADGKADSKWTYYNDGKTFKTAAEQIMNETTVYDRLENSIHVSWVEDPKDGGFIRVESKDEVVQEITLDATAKQDMEYTVTGLKSATTYTISIWNGTPANPGKKRGSLTVATAVPIPESDYIYEVANDVEAIDQELIDFAAQQAYDNAVAAGKNPDVDGYAATIAIPAELTLNACGIDPETGNNTGLKLPDHFSVTFFGRAGGEAPLLNVPKSFDIADNHGYIRFQNIKFFDSGCQYFINQSTASNVAELSFSSCEFTDFDRSLVRTQGSVNILIDKIIVDDCILTNMAKGNGYSVFYFGSATTTVGSLELKNSTFNTSQRSFIEASACAAIAGGVTISDCTFYNNVAAGRYFMDANGKETNLTMIRTILAKPFDTTENTGAKGVRTNGKMSFEECLRTNDCVYAGNDISADLLEVSSYSSADIFTDPDGSAAPEGEDGMYYADFTLKITTKVGDPRWYKQ